MTLSMFYSSVKHLGDDEQNAKWMPMIKDVKMIGCYAQTELGHGSNVPVIRSSCFLI